MLAFAKALLLIARYFRRIAASLERLEKLYEADCRSRGITLPDPAVADEVEVQYSSKSQPW